jgi:hypothetical protein
MTMPTFKLSWRTRILLRWVNIKRALDIGSEPRPLMGLPDSQRRPGWRANRSMAPFNPPPAFDPDLP